MDYVALLRGINVGGNNKINMKELKEEISKNNFSNVRTYINSGNILFTYNSKSSLSELQNKFENMIEKRFSLKIKTLIIEKSKFEKIANQIPKDWTNDKEKKTDILFLNSNVNNKEIVDSLPIKPNIDSTLFIDGAVIWNINRKNISKTGLIKLVGTKLYSNMTIRNSNTVNRIKELLE